MTPWTRGGAGLAIVLVLAGCSNPEIDEDVRGETLLIAALADDQLQEAASVVTVHAWPDQNAKLFAVSDRDSGLNDLSLYLGLSGEPGQGWRIHPIAKVDGFDIADVEPGRIEIQARQTLPRPHVPPDDRGLVEVIPQQGRFIVEFDPIATQAATVRVTTIGEMAVGN